jgi:hypothetical protein
MQFRRTTSFSVLFLITAFILSACGGGGDSSSPAPLPPTIVTSAVNTPSVDNALINGSVNPNGLTATAWFEYGQDNTMSTFTKTADQAIAAGTVPQSINATLLNLSAGTKYYYRVAASSSAGTSKGTISNFNTLSLPPTTTTTPASSITINSATLLGDVNPNGLATTAWFEYGQDNTFTTLTKTTDQVIGSGKIPVSITQPITGLLAGTTYYFRVAASSTGGTSNGTTKSFATSPNPPPLANAGVDQSAFMGHPVTLNGSGSSDGGNGGTITYQWTQVGGTPATLSGATTPSPTFTAPTVSYPGDNLVFQLTVTSSRGPTAADNVTVTDKWGFFDDFSTDTTGTYTTVITSGTFGTLTYDAVGQRARVTTGDDNVMKFIHSLPSGNNGVFSVDFSPTIPYPSHGGLWIRLKQDALNYYEVSNFDWTSFGGTPAAPDLAGVRKFVGGVMVDEVLFPTSYIQGNTYGIKITFSPTKTTMLAFGQSLDLTTNGTSILVNQFEVETGQQDAFYDNIKLEAAP